MKNKSFIFMSLITIAAALYALPLYAQESQNIGVNIPFSFAADGKNLPAGQYRIETSGDSRNLWRIRGANGDGGRFLLALTRDSNPGVGAMVTFHRYGDHYFLTGFKTSDYSVSLPTSKNEKKTRLAAGPMAMEVIEVKTSTSLGGSR